MSIAFNGPTVIEGLRRDRTAAPEWVERPSQRLAEFLSQWQRQIDADPFPAILLDEAAAAARRGAQSAADVAGVVVPLPLASTHAHGAPAGQESPSVPHSLPPLDATAG